jgi:hypothetical protein
VARAAAARLRLDLLPEHFRPLTQIEKYPGTQEVEPERVRQHVPQPRRLARSPRTREEEGPIGHRELTRTWWASRRLSSMASCTRARFAYAIAH